MSLEEELQVSKFKSSRHRLTVNLMYTSNWMTSQMQVVFRQYGVTNQQYNILRILRGMHPEPCTIQVLKQRMFDKQPDVSRLVDRLQTKELVARKSNLVDRRKMDVLISGKGLTLLKEMDPVVNNFDNIFAGLSDEEVDQMNSLLDKARGYCLD